MDPPSISKGTQKDAETLLQMEQLFSEAIINSMPGMIYLYNEERRFLRWNRTFETVSEYSAEEIAQIDPLDFFVGHEKDLIDRKIDEAFAAGDASVEADFTTKSGRSIPFFLTGRRVLFNGKPCVIGMGIDISECRRTEEALRESEQKYRELVQHANSIILRWTRDGRLTFMNEFGLKFFGYTAEELVGRHVVGTIVPEVESGSRDLRTLMERILADPVAFEQNTNENVCRDGRRAWIQWTNKTVRDKHGEILEVLSIGTDITERKRAEEQIAEQAAFLDKARDAIIARSLNGEILFWNEGAERIYGWKRDEVQGRNIGVLLHADPHVFEDLSRRILEENEWSGELHHLTKTKQEIIVESRWTLIRDMEGNPKSILSINSDITERKRIEGQFLRAQRMESIGTLAGGIAHDLNNILAPIMMSIELLRDNMHDEESEKILRTIAISARRGADIVRQVLSFARGIEGQRVEIQPKHLVKDLTQIIRDTFPKDIRLDFFVPEDIWTILGDPTQVHQVLLNLCVNGRDAMPNGGELGIRVENRVLDEHFAAMHIQAKPGRYVEIIVTDTGAGIPPENLDKIYEPFFTTKELNKGTGLGLSTVMAIVKSHNGLINVYSEIGRGTVFHAYFPAMEASSDARKELLEDASLTRGRGETILLVDDEASIRTVTGQTLQAFGYKVITASDGAQALAVYAKHQPEISLVLTDMRMPVLAGSPMIQALLRINPTLKIIAASGLDTGGSLSAVSGPGVKAFLIKPYTAETLLKTIRAALDER
jgi:PAS domain S-box-containing protein